MKPFRLFLHLLGFLEQLHEHRDLRQEYLGHNGLEDEVHGAESVAPGDLLVVPAERRDEDDRGAPQALAAPDDLGGLEAVHPRHLDVQQDHRNALGVLLEETFEGFLAGMGLHKVLPEVGEHGLQGGQVLRPVVHHQNVGFRLGAHDPTSDGRDATALRNEAISASGRM